MPVALDEAFALRLVELRLHRGNRQPGALLEERQRKAFDEPQRIQHEFERQFSNRHRFLDGEGVRGGPCIRAAA